MNKSNRRKQSASERQESHCFRYYEMLQSIIKDLEWIDQVIPRESSRYAPASLENEADAIIQGRKDDLLSYIQTICRDHMLYSKWLIESGEKTAPWRPSAKPGKFRGSATPFRRQDRIGYKD